MFDQPRAAPVLQRLLAALVVFGSLPINSTAQSTPEAIQQVDQIFEAWDSELSPGCAVGVSQFGEPLLERAYGMADLEHGIANASTTIFEGGSVSKQFTAAAIVLLVLDGVLSLDDDVREYVPELPDYGHTITLHHLMTHTSGLRDWGSVAGISGWGRGDRSHDHADVIDILSRQGALNFVPGSEYSYSNSGYNLLAIVVDRVSGTSFAEFSEERIFGPLGMTSTQWRDDYRRIVPGRSTAYRRAVEAWEIDRPIEYVHGNGGILTTVRDLSIWNQALTDGRLGGDEFLRLMHLQGRLNDGSEIVYAGGLRVSSFAGVSSVTHTGSTAGYRAFLGRYPEQGLSVAMLCNASNVSTSGTGGRIARAFLGPAVRDEPEPDFAAASADVDLSLYPGLYADPVTGNPLEVTLRDGVLYSGSTPLLPLASTAFQVGTGDRRYVFSVRDRQADGFRVEDWQYTEQRYVRVEPWHPTSRDFVQLSGTYHSDDAETSYRVYQEGETLRIWQRPNVTRSLRPIYRDAFRVGGSVVRFRRDESGRVVELTQSLGRVYDMRFAKTGS